MARFFRDPLIDYLDPGKSPFNLFAHPPGSLWHNNNKLCKECAVQFMVARIRPNYNYTKTFTHTFSWGEK